MSSLVTGGGGGGVAATAAAAAAATALARFDAPPPAVGRVGGVGAGGLPTAGNNGLGSSCGTADGTGSGGRGTDTASLDGGMARKQSIAATTDSAVATAGTHARVLSQTAAHARTVANHRAAYELPGNAPARPVDSEENNKHTNSSQNAKQG